MTMRCCTTSIEGVTFNGFTLLSEMCVNLQKEYNKGKLQTMYLLNFFILSVECECVKRELVTYVVDIKALPFLPN